MTKARTIAFYKIYNSNVANYAVTEPKISQEPFLENWGLVTDSSIEYLEDFGTIT